MTRHTGIGTFFASETVAATIQASIISPISGFRTAEKAPALVLEPVLARETVDGGGASEAGVEAGQTGETIGVVAIWALTHTLVLAEGEDMQVVGVRTKVAEV